MTDCSFISHQSLEQSDEEVYFDNLVWQEDNVYVSYCPQLDVSSCGDTVDEARRMLKEAVSLFLEEAEKKGTLQDILEESGYHLKNNKEWIPPKIVATEFMYISTGDSKDGKGKTLWVKQ